MTKHAFLLAQILTCLLAITPITVSAFQLPAGKWEIKTEMVNPMFPQPQVKTEIECIEDGAFDPTTELMEEGQCTVSDKQETDSSISWAFECGGQGMPPTKGTGSFHSSGKTATGEMKMTMAMGGQSMTMTNRWKARHISKQCD